MNKEPETEPNDKILTASGFKQSDINMITRAAEMDKLEHYKLNRSDWIRAKLLKAAHSTLESGERKTA